MNHHQKAILDNHCDNIVNGLMVIVYCFTILLVTFDIVHSFFGFFVAIGQHKINSIIKKQLNQFYQKQPPTQKTIKLIKHLYWLLCFMFIGIGAFCFYYVIVYK